MAKASAKWFVVLCLTWAFITPTISCSSVGTRTKFESLAGKLKFFLTCEFVYNMDDFRWIPENEAQQYKQLLAELRAIEAEMPILVDILNHKDPKVRTLALAALYDREDPKALPHIASLMYDCAETFPDIEGRFNCSPTWLTEKKLRPPVKQTVSQVVRQMLKLYMVFFWTDNPDYQHQNMDHFKAYWAKRKDRSYCAGWFRVQLTRACGSACPTPKNRVERVQTVRKRIDKLPETDRAWILLWLNGHPGSDVLVTEEELIEACKKLGPEKLLALLARKISSDDPDVQPRKSSNWWYRSMCLFVLKRADELLRERDAQPLLDCERWERDYLKHGIGDPTITPWWAIAAAHLQPDKAEAILHGAFKRFDGKRDGDERADIAAALWKLIGKSQTKFLINWYYTEPLQRGHHPQCRTRFLRSVSKFPNSHPHGLVATIVQDKRFEDLDWQCFEELVHIVNGWLDKPVIDRKSLEKRFNTLKEKLRASVPRWNK